MKIIISPAKKMNVDTDSLPFEGMPIFLTEAERILARLRGMSYEELKSLWNCNDAIARLNFERVQAMDLRRNLTPAVLAYEGIQYQAMAPGVFDYSELAYVNENLRILSGFYGVLRPFDGVVPYRLEMQARLRLDDYPNLYEFWGNKPTTKLCDDGIILNLASKEYSKAVSAHLPPNIEFVTCVFGEMKDGKVVEKGTMCKLARGAMVRFLAERKVASLDGVKEFDVGYAYSEELSDDKRFVFIREENENA